MKCKLIIFRHLALAMEEDDDDVLQDVQLWLETEDENLDIFCLQKYLFRQIGYRGTISRTCCETVMRKINPNHEIWKRHRHINHSGAVSQSKR